MLLFILLIAVIASSTEMEQEPILEGINWRELWEEVKHAYDADVQWFKDNELYEPLINLIKNKGKEVGINLCE